MDADLDAQLDADLQAMKPRWHALDFIGLAAGLVPFFLSFSTSESSTVTVTGGGLNASTTTTHHMDYIALGGGAVAVLCALAGLAVLGKMRARGMRFGVFAALLALGGFQVIRGALVPEGTSTSGVISR